MPTPPADLVLARYRLGARIAVGGMGELFLAEGPDGKTVVIKALLPQLAKDPQMVAQFLDEARLAARMKHANLVQVHEFGQWQSTWVLAMEHVDGLDLGHVVRRAAKQKLSIPWQFAAAVIAEAALGLQFAHDLKDGEGKHLGLIHRDVSPQNILVGRNGRTRVLDFGIADSVDKSTRTATGVVKGKLAYMSPEQANGEDLKPASDQFSLGLVLWELLTGKRAFASNSDVALLKEVLSGNVAKPTTLNPSIPAGLEAVVMKMLSTSAKDRYSNCRDVQFALRALVPGDPQQQVIDFVKQLPDEAPAVPTELGRTPLSAKELGATPSIGGRAPPTPQTPISRPKSVTPRLDAFVAGLPSGLASFPDMQHKGSIVHTFLEGVPISEHLKELPAELADLVRRPPLPSAWIPEVKAYALYMACSELCFPSPEAYVAFAHRANQKIIQGPLYAMLFRVLGVKRIVSVVAGRWAQFHRGSQLSVVAFEGNEGRLKLECPPHATPLLVAQCHGTAVQATIETVGAKDVTVQCTQSGPGTFDYLARWRES